MGNEATTETGSADNVEEAETVSPAEQSETVTEAETATETEDESSKDVTTEDDEKVEFWKRQARDNEKELKKLRKAEEDRRKAELSEADLLREEKEEIAKELEGLRRKAIIAEFGLTPELAERLRGVTEEELREDAGELAKLVRPAKPKSTDVGIGSPGGNGDTPSNPMDLHRKWISA